MWYYYIYVMCDKLRDAEEEYFDRNYSKYEDEDDDDDEPYGTYRRGGRMGRSSYGRRRKMATEEISTGNRYLIYYNKSNGIFQTVNHIIPSTTATA